MQAENFLGPDLEAFQLFERQINSPARGVGAHVTQDVGELERFAEPDRVVATTRVAVAEDFDAEPSHHRRHAVAIQLQLGVGFVAFDVEVHLDAANQFVKQGKGELVSPYDGLQLPIDREAGRALFARLTEVLPPVGQPPATFLDRDRFLIGHVVHLAAKGIKCGHVVAFCFGQQHKGQSEIGGAFARYRLADGRGHKGGSDEGSVLVVGKPPVSASVGLRGRWSRRRFRRRRPW